MAMRGEGYEGHGELLYEEREQAARVEAIECIPWTARSAQRVTCDRPAAEASAKAWLAGQAGVHGRRLLRQRRLPSPVATSSTHLRAA